MGDQKAKKGQTDEEFEPICKWQRMEDRDTLEIHLQEFKKEQLKVQIGHHGSILKISGERALDAFRMKKFHTEIRISSNYDAQAIRAKFINGWLHITIPKIQTQVPGNDGNSQIGQSKVEQTPEQESLGRILHDINSVAKVRIQKHNENFPTISTSQGQKHTVFGQIMGKLAMLVVAISVVVAYVYICTRPAFLKLKLCY